MNAGFLIFKRKAVTGLDVLFAFILFVLLNFLAGSLLSNTKLDLTEDGLFTLTPATLKIAASMEEPIKLNYFFSNNLTILTELEYIIVCDAIIVSYNSHNTSYFHSLFSI